MVMKALTIVKMGDMILPFDREDKIPKSFHSYVTRQMKKIYVQTSGSGTIYRRSYRPKTKKEVAHLKTLGIRGSAIQIDGEWR